MSAVLVLTSMVYRGRHQRCRYHAALPFVRADLSIYDVPLAIAEP
jgi:hypothetical protein